jgi:uncharacterized protein (TIGR03083 family)
MEERRMLKESDQSLSFFEPDLARVRDLSRARAALEVVVPSFLQMLRGAKDPGLHAVGDWSIGDLAVHMSHVAMGGVLAASAIGQPIDKMPDGGGSIINAATNFNEAGLAGDPERDLAILADRIEDGSKEFMALIADRRGDEPVVWLGGIVIPASMLGCHFLEEFLVHGYDVARALNTTWRIRPEHAALCFGFLMDMIRFGHADTRRSFVDQSKAAGLNLRFDFRLRGDKSFYVTFEDGLVTVEDPSPRPVDCRISSDPVSALLVGMGRVSPVRSALTGGTIAWGRKPWLAFKFKELLKNP